MKNISGLKPEEEFGNFTVSLYASLSTKQAAQPVSLQQVHRLITDNMELKEATEKYRYFRSQGFEADAARIKRSHSPAFTPAALFGEKRQYKHLQSFTGLSLADYDHLTPEELSKALELLESDPYWVLVYITLSGYGLRIIFRVSGVTDRRTYAQAFLQGNAHYRRLLGLQYDAQVCDATRPSALCHDPHARYRPLAQAYPVNYDRLTVQEVLPNIENELKKKGLQYRPGEHNEYISQACYLFNKYGVPETEVEEWATATFTDYADEGGVERIVHSCYRHRDDHGTRTLHSRSTCERGSRHASVGEIEDFLTEQGEYRYNVITGKLEVKWKESDRYQEVVDRIENSLWARMNKQAKPANIKDICNVLRSEFVPEFNPFKSYFDSLPPWDGKTDHIARLAATVHLADPSQNDIFLDCLRRWLVAMIPTLLLENVVNHTILIFIGKQGGYKTTWFRNLLPPELRSYFYTKTNSSRFNKDDLFTLSEFALMCFEEIESMTRSEMNHLKALVTLDTVNERAAYGRNKERRPHIASFCGTGNNVMFLNDDTGSRRFLPFEVENIDNPYHTRLDYTGIYSQAHHLWKEGFMYWFEQEDIERINHHNRQFEVPHLEEELIQTYYIKGDKRTDCSFLTIANILERINVGIKQQLSPVKVGMALKKLGFNSKRIKGRRVYLVVEQSMEKVKASQKILGRDVQEPPVEDSKEDAAAEEMSLFQE